MASDSVTIISRGTWARSLAPGADLLLFTATLAAMVAVLAPVSVGGFDDGFPLSLLTLLAPLMLLMEAAYLVRNRSELKFGAVETTLLIFTAYFLARNFASAQGLVAVKYAVYGPGLFLALSLLFESNRYRDMLVFAITGLAGLTALYGMAEYVFQDGILSPYALAESIRGLHRVGSTIVHPVAYGALLVQALPFCILAIIRSRGWRMHCFSISATVWATVALILTFSKGSWLSVGVLALLLLAVLIVRKDVSGLKAAGGFLLGMVAIGGVFYNQIVSEFIWRRQSSFGVQLQMWEWTLAAIREHFLLGVGLRNGSFDLAEHGALEWYRVLSSTLPIDNFYLTLWLETGIAGIALFLIFIGFLLKEGARSVLSGGDTAWGLALMASILGILLNSMTFEALLNWPNLLFFWITAAALHATARRQPHA